MADITMCTGGGCPKREDCYRFTARPNEFRQSYFYLIPFDHAKGDCDHFTSNLAEQAGQEGVQG